MSTVESPEDVMAADKVTCELSFELPSEEVARRVLGSVDADNEGFVDARLDGRVLLATVRAESLNSMLHTLDDFMACLSVAHKVVSG